MIEFSDTVVTTHNFVMSALFWLPYGKQLTDGLLFIEKEYLKQLTPIQTVIATVLCLVGFKILVSIVCALRQLTIEKIKK